MNINETISLIPLAIKNLLYNSGIKIIESVRFGKNIWWWKLQLALLLFYFLDNPYRIIMRNINNIDIDTDNLIYGETPLITAEKMLKIVNPGKKEKYIDLGCGRGLTVFLAGLVFKIEATGIDVIPEFIQRSRIIKDYLKLPGINFIQGNFIEEDLSSGTIFFIAGTTFDDKTIHRLTEKLVNIPGRISIISLSAALPSTRFKTIHSEELRFSWGKSTVYFQIKEESS